MTKNIQQILPPVGEHNNIPGLDGHGRWQEIGAPGVLEILADALKVEANPESSSLVSIPDVWAHVEVFRGALFDSNSQRNAVAVAEWRGLLALLALKPYYGYILTIRRIQLTAPRAVPVGEVGDFRSVLGIDLPTATFSDDVNWNELATIHIDDKLVGLVCPSTLVVPSSNYRQALPKTAIPWFSANGLADPTRTRDVHVEQLFTLREYAKGLTGPLLQLSGGRAAPAIRQSLLRILDGYTDDIQKRLGQTSPPQMLPYSITRDLPSNEVYSALGQSWETAPPTSPRFDVALAARQPKFGFVAALIFDPSIPNTVGRHPAEVFVWNRSSIQGLQRECGVSDRLHAHKIAEETARAGYLLLTADDLFLPTLCRVKERRRVNFHGQALGDFLLPYNPAILLFLSPRELRDCTRIEPTDSGFAVTLSLELASSSPDRPMRAMLRQEYRRRTGLSAPAEAGMGWLIEAEWPETLVSWPNFSHPDWPWNFAFSSANPQIQFTVQSAISGDGLADTLGSIPDYRQRAETARRWLRQPPTAHRRLPIREVSGVVTDLFLMDQAPEALVLYQNTQQEGEPVPLDRREPAGLLLLDALEKPTMHGEEMAVGIDFGTSNTCIYVRKGQESPRPLTFRKRVVSPFGDIDDNEQQSLTDFIPAVDIFAPFQSVLKDRGVDATAKHLPVWTDHIYFVENLSKSVREALGKTAAPESTVARPGRLLSNLKWATGQTEREQVARFIGQAALMTGAEALAEGVSVHRLRWRFSYPEAFDPRRYRDYLELYSTGAKFVFGPDALHNAPTLGSKPLTESVAAALYFGNRERFKAAFSETVVTIDIGGHTSDISIWQKKKLLWRSSVALAGRHLVSSFLAKDLDLLESIVKGMPLRVTAPSPIDEIRSAASNEQRRFAVEVLLNYRAFSAAMLSRLALADHNRVDRLTMVAEFMLAGLLHHIGHQIQALHEAGAFDAKRRITQIYLGGRTSQLYRTLFRDYHDVLGGITEMLRDSCGIEEMQAQIDFSEEPKHEVAYGLVIDSTKLDLDDKDPSTDVVIGEHVVAGKKSYDPGTCVSALLAAKDLRIDELIGFDQFLANLRRLGRIKVEIPNRVRGKIIGQVNTALQTAMTTLRETATDEDDSRGNTISVESPFLMALRESVAAIIEEDITISRLT